MSNLQSASFFATIAPIMSGIKTGGDGMRVQFDIPEKEMGEAAKLLAMRGQVLKITVEILTQLDDEIKKEPERGGNRVDRRRFADQ